MENAKAGIKEIEKLFSSLGMPATFKDLGIKNVDIKRIVNIVTNNGNRIIEHPKKNMDSEVVKTIIESCL